MVGLYLVKSSGLLSFESVVAVMMILALTRSEESTNSEMNNGPSKPNFTLSKFQFKPKSRQTFLPATFLVSSSKPSLPLQESSLKTTLPTPSPTTVDEGHTAKDFRCPPVTPEKLNSLGKKSLLDDEDASNDIIYSSPDVKVGRDKFDYSINSMSPSSSCGKPDLNSCISNNTPKTPSDSSKMEETKQNISRSLFQDSESATGASVALVDDLFEDSASVVVVDSSINKTATPEAQPARSQSVVTISSSSDDSDFEINKSKYSRIKSNRKFSIKSKTPVVSKKRFERHSSPVCKEEQINSQTSVSPRPSSPGTLSKKRLVMKKRLLTPEKAGRLREQQRLRKSLAPPDPDPPNESKIYNLNDSVTNGEINSMDEASSEDCIGTWLDSLNSHPGLMKISPNANLFELDESLTQSRACEKLILEKVFNVFVSLPEFVSELIPALKGDSSLLSKLRT
uniref:Uncharacterized protein n=1 Tax=Lygus hesperus TaxID=30085 RepID=A0A0A9YIB7_LYGHE